MDFCNILYRNGRPVAPFFTFFNHKMILTGRVICYLCAIVAASQQIRQVPMWNSYREMASRSFPLQKRNSLSALRTNPAVAG